MTANTKYSSYYVTPIFNWKARERVCRLRTLEECFQEVEDSEVFDPRAPLT